MAGKTEMIRARVAPELKAEVEPILAVVVALLEIFLTIRGSMSDQGEVA